MLNILKTLLLLIVILLLFSSCWLIKKNFDIQLRIKNSSSNELYQVKLETVNLTSIEKNSYSDFYSVWSAIESIQIKLTANSEWETCELNFGDKLEEDCYYTVFIYDNLNSYDNDFKISVYKEDDPFKPYYLLTMQIDGKDVQCTTDEFFNYDETYNYYKFSIHNYDGFYINNYDSSIVSDLDIDYIYITLPKDIQSGVRYSNDDETLPADLHFSINLGNDDYYAIHNSDFNFDITHWNYDEKEITANFNGIIDMILTSKDLVITDGSISKVYP